MLVYVCDVRYDGTCGWRGSGRTVGEMSLTSSRARGSGSGAGTAAGEMHSTAMRPLMRPSYPDKHTPSCLIASFTHLLCTLQAQKQLEEEADILKHVLQKQALKAVKELAQV